MIEVLHSISLQTSERVPRLCAQLLPHIRTWAKERPSFPVVSWQEFVKKVKEINKTADEEGARNVAFYLNESAEVRRKITTNNNKNSSIKQHFISTTYIPTLVYNDGVAVHVIIGKKCTII